MLHQNDFIANKSHFGILWSLELKIQTMKTNFQNQIFLKDFNKTCKNRRHPYGYDFD